MKFNPDVVPSTIEAAVNQIVDSLEEADIQAIKESSGAHEFHHGTGRMFRNQWSLWENDSPLKRDAVNTYKIAHADDISGLIMDWVDARVKDKDFDPQACCQRFHDHWSAMGMTSLEAGGWEDGS